MTILNQTNRDRVDKMTGTLGLIRKSAKSNMATSDQLWDLLSPLIGSIETMISHEDIPEEPQSSSQPPELGSDPNFSQITVWAQTAPLRDLHAVMHQFMSRIDHELYSKTGK